MNSAKKSFSGFHSSEGLFLLIILVIFFGFLIPALNRTQADEKDKRRMQDLAFISSALEGYYNDYQAYPPAPKHGFIDRCLSPMDGSEAVGGSTVEVLNTYLKPKKLPQAIQGQITLDCIDSYYYQPIEQAGIPNQAYVLVTVVDSPKSANFEIPISQISPDYFKVSDSIKEIASQLIEISSFSKGKVAFYVVIP